MILFDKNDLLKALNGLYEYSELGEVIKFIEEDFEKNHSVIRSEGKPILIVHDQVVYLTEEHIEVLKAYEEKKMLDEMINRRMKSIEQMKKLDGVFPSIKKIEPEE